MRKLIDKFNKNNTYIFKRDYVNSNIKIYDLVDGKKVNIINDGSGHVRHNKVLVNVTPNMCDEIVGV